MTKSTLTTKDIQLIYESAVHDEATKSDESGFVLDCVLDDAGGTGATIRKLIDMVRARDVELLAVREAQSKPVAYRYRYNGKHLASVGCGDMVSSWKYCEEADLVNPDERYESQVLFTAPPAPAVRNWEHISNEWADVATSALVWLKNIADGISTPETAIENTELGIAAVRAAMLQPVSQGYTLPEGENCWSCGKYFTYAQHSECDGYCPHCNAPVDLEDDEDQPSPSVPDEMTGALAMTKYGIKRSNYTQWVKGWNACRVEMLPSTPALTEPDEIDKFADQVCGHHSKLFPCKMP